MKRPLPPAMEGSYVTEIVKFWEGPVLSQELSTPLMETSFISKSESDESNKVLGFGFKRGHFLGAQGPGWNGAGERSSCEGSPR